MPTIIKADAANGNRALALLPGGSALFWACIGTFLLASYLPVFALYATQHWSANNLQGAYAHAPLTVVLVAFLVWRQRDKLSLPERSAAWSAGLLFLSLGAAIKIYGDFQGYVVLQGMSLIPVMLGLLYAYCSADAARALRFPVLLLFFIIPLPGAAIDALTVPLMRVTAELVVALLPLLDMDVLLAGHVLTVNAHGASEFHEIILAPECSGIRSFVSLLALSTVFAHFQGRNAMHSALLLLLTIPLVIAGNCIRVTLTILMVVKVSPDTAEGFFHWSSGLLLFATTLLGLFLFDALIAKARTQVDATND